MTIQAMSGAEEKTEKSPEQFSFGIWYPIETCPYEYTWDKADLWLSVQASPMSFGISDAWRVPDCFKREGKWGHVYRGQFEELREQYITHWMPLPPPPCSGDREVEPKPTGEE